MQKLCSVDEVRTMIEEGKKLLLAGAEKLLSGLPEGHWIGGTIPYFMADDGGEFSEEKIFVNILPDYIKRLKLNTYHEDTISNIYRDAFENGLSVIIIPSSSPTHMSFALNAPTYDDFAHSPLIGWISGINLNGEPGAKAKVFFGEKCKALEDGAVVMHMEIPSGKYAEIDIINIFKQGTGDIISFGENTFSVTECLVNGEKTNFADYLKENSVDTKFPLVADYAGAMINTSFQGVDEAEKKVTFYAPVFRDVEYRLAAPMENYMEEFSANMPAEDPDTIFFSCNCILNYLYCELEGKSTGGIKGPITFGEIAYQLVNQTLVFASIK